tara:strand:- start:2660 stop:3046 length:387 start_codon:yes stop_codon:yes gene_type:complete
MSEIKDDLKYSSEHEWVKVEGENVSVGITDHAQDSLGEIVFVELPQVGDTLEKSSIFGAVESTKSVSDLYSPIAGTVLEVNSLIENEPDLINSSPYEEGWMIKIAPSNSSDLDKLLSSEEYKNLINGE